MLNAVQIGAGNIGRGLNAFILNKNEYHVTFLDVSEDLVKKINSIKKYEVVQKGEVIVKDLIRNYNAFNILMQADESAESIANASIVFISVGISNLPKLKHLFTKAFEIRIKKGIKSNLNIVAVENGINASSYLQLEISDGWNDEIKKYVEKFVSFPNCAVDRIVPNQSTDTLDVQVEPFFELVIDENKWLGSKIDLVKYSNNLDKFIQRKLFMLNATHAFIAWYGIKNNINYIYEFVNNSKIRNKVIQLLETFTKILSTKFDFSISELQDYSEKIISRLSNEYIKDEVTRVGRGVKRKISSKDRFVVPLMFAYKNNIDYKIIVEALAYAYSGLDFNDPEVIEINQYIKENSLSEAIKKYSEIKEQKIVDMIIEYVEKI